MYALIVAGIDFTNIQFSNDLQPAVDEFSELVEEYEDDEDGMIRTLGVVEINGPGNLQIIDGLEGDGRNIIVHNTWSNNDDNN